jgi:putative addiction module antidote
MSNALKIIQIGNSLGVILPKEILARMNVEKGDTVYLVRTADGFLLTPYNPDFQRQLEAQRIRKHSKPV